MANQKKANPAQGHHLYHIGRRQQPTLERLSMKEKDSGGTHGSQHNTSRKTDVRAGHHLHRPRQ
ncbi:hypothetical protein CR513_30012, partial [Mucuna pruriens]